MNSYKVNSISVNDVLHTLRECDRNERFDSIFEHMLTFASELTGISEDSLSSSMYDLTVESWKDMQRKYHSDRDAMDEEEEIRFVEDCFGIYEKEGFSSVYWSPFTDHEERKGQPFEVISRCTMEDQDLCTLPMWKIKFADGKLINAYPEEIVPSEMRANGCSWFVEDKTITSGAERSGEGQQTRRLNVTIACQAVYNSSIDVPKELSIEEALEYAKMHIAEIPLGALDYIPDSDVLDIENCDFEDKVSEPEMGNLVGREENVNPTLSNRIQLASSRAAEPQASPHVKIKDTGLRH